MNAASKGGYSDIVQLLLGHPEVSVQQGDILGTSPLMNAAMRGDVKIGRMLLKKYVLIFTKMAEKTL